MESGYPGPRTFVQDLLTEDPLPVRESFFDGIIYDAPCTGSGTWARTPERLGNFHPSSLGRITDIQRRIGDKIIAYLNPGGFLIYITCSVFTSENEEIVHYLVENHAMILKKQEYLKGFKIGADTLFVARLQKPR
jgi:16S rRNA (cytosine967-C5)-methyltransferase